MLPRLFISLPLYICVCALSCIHAFLRRSWFESPLVCCHTPIRQYVSTYVRQCISTYVCQYASGAVCLSVRADLPFSNVCFRPCPFICLVASSFLSAKEYTNPPVCIVSPLRGSIWLRSGSLWRFSATSRCVFTPYLCPQAAGQRSRCAHRTPGSVLLLGSRRVSGDRYLYGLL